jgi:hypothetical protein
LRIVIMACVPLRSALPAEAGSLPYRIELCGAWALGTVLAAGRLVGLVNRSESARNAGFRAVFSNNRVFRDTPDAATHHYR